MKLIISWNYKNFALSVYFLTYNPSTRVKEVFSQDRGNKMSLMKT
jgi:hypothetical protein